MGQGHTECAFGTGNALLRYGIDTRCAKQPPVVRDAFSEALGAQKQAFPVRKGYSVHENPLWCTQRVFKGPPPIQIIFADSRRQDYPEAWSQIPLEIDRKTPGKN